MKPALALRARLIQDLRSHFPTSPILKFQFLTFLRGYQSRTHLSLYTLAVGAATFLASAHRTVCDQGPTKYDGTLIGPQTITPWKEFLIDLIPI